MNTDSFIVYTVRYDIYKDIVEDVETRFDTSNYELGRPFPKGTIKEEIGLMKDKLGGKVMTKLVALRSKTYGYLINEDSEDKKSKGTKNVCHNKNTYI